MFGTSTNKSDKVYVLSDDVSLAAIKHIMKGKIGLLFLNAIKHIMKRLSHTNSSLSSCQKTLLSLELGLL